MKKKLRPKKPKKVDIDIKYELRQLRDQLRDRLHGDLQEVRKSLIKYIDEKTLPYDVMKIQGQTINNLTAEIIGRKL